MYESTYFHSNDTAVVSQVSEKCCSIIMMATKRLEGTKRVWSVTRGEAKDILPFIRAHNRFQELCFRGATARGMACFLLTTVFYIQTNEGAGRKIMRDGVRKAEREKQVE